MNDPDPLADIVAQDFSDPSDPVGELEADVDPDVESALEGDEEEDGADIAPDDELVDDVDSLPDV